MKKDGDELTMCSTDYAANMKFQVNPNYILREVAGESILVPTGKEVVNFNGLATLNETGAFLWRFLEQEQTFEHIVECFCREYELTQEEGQADVSAFLSAAVTRNAILKTC